MAGQVVVTKKHQWFEERSVDDGPRWMRWAMISAGIGFLVLFLIVPLVLVFVYALSQGLHVYAAALVDPEAWSAIRLTLVVAAIVVPVNVIFGVAAAWAITRYRFRGRQLLVTLIDLPFAISPVIAGLMFVLLLGSHAWLGGLLESVGIRVIFTPVGIALVTAFVTLPFIARELIPLMEAQGSEEEQAAWTLGAGGFQILLRVTLPKIKWGLLYGVILCNARAIGEFGAVSVVSGHISGYTNTASLHIEILYHDYQFSAAFAVASLLTITALLTLAVKAWVEHKSVKETEPNPEQSTGEHSK